MPWLRGEALRLKFFFTWRVALKTICSKNFGWDATFADSLTDFETEDQPREPNQGSAPPSKIGNLCVLSWLFRPQARKSTQSSFKEASKQHPSIQATKHPMEATSTGSNDQASKHRCNLKRWSESASVKARAWANFPGMIRINKTSSVTESKSACTNARIKATKNVDAASSRQDFNGQAFCLSKKQQWAELQPTSSDHKRASQCAPSLPQTLRTLEQASNSQFIVWPATNFSRTSQSFIIKLARTWC
jgi:hypothetical protein